MKGQQVQSEKIENPFIVVWRRDTYRRPFWHRGSGPLFLVEIGEILDLGCVIGAASASARATVLNVLIIRRAPPTEHAAERAGASRMDRPPSLQPR